MIASRALLVAAFLGSAWGSAAAQQRAERCRVQLVFARDSAGVLGQTYFASGGVRLRCAGQAVTMETDSVLAHPSGDVEFHGYMRYRDTTVAIDAQRAYYRKATETWEARGNVIVRDLETGSTLRGPTVDYFRAAAGMRDSSEVYATGRPRVEYYDVSADSVAGSPREPYIIVSDRLRSRGKGLMWAGGRVTIDRSDLSARGDSLMLDTGTGDQGMLTGEPLFRGLGSDSFDLRGSRIDFRLAKRRIQYVRAGDGGRLVRADWNLVADTIAIDVDSGQVQHMAAWGSKTRADVTSDRYAVKADSVEFETPAEVLTQIRAYGKAWVSSLPDSARREADWMAGDTVIADFARNAGDSTESSLSRLAARRDARSFRQVASSEAGKPPGLAYVTGDAITVIMKPGDEKTVERVDVVGKVEGVQLDPSGTER